MSARTLLRVCLGAVGVCGASVVGPAAAQSYLQGGDLNSIRQSTQRAQDAQPGIVLAPPAPRPERSGSVGAQFNQGMAESEREALRKREMSANSNMQMDRMINPQRQRYPGEPASAQGGSVAFDGQSVSACRNDPASGQAQCGAVSR
ncbi:hypothetical protein [Pandoraea pulmonicola]|nr:hypothetical protein [Pandoraea pulmonicola]